MARLESEDLRRQAVAAAYSAQGARLWRAVYAYARSPEIASDAVAEAIAQALSARSEIRDASRWIWAVAFRLAAAELAARGGQAELTDRVAASSPGDALELLDALATLSPNQRRVLVLHGYGGYRPAEIAEMLGSSAATVRVHLSKGRARLRRALEEVDDGD